ncbi:MAG: AAA family ATPase [Clostridia bacterium]|nr:AAA family ATPase [Clostridia bacterium]
MEEHDCISIFYPTSDCLQLGNSMFPSLRESHRTYVDKTQFISQWLRDGYLVTILLRPRRFGKTLALSTVHAFFTVDHPEYAALFEGTKVDSDTEAKRLQNQVPVIFLSFHSIEVKEPDEIRSAIARTIQEVYQDFLSSVPAGALDQKTKEELSVFSESSKSDMIAHSLRKIMKVMEKTYGQKVMVLIDEYDHVMYPLFQKPGWDEVCDLLRAFMEATFKDNSSLMKGLITGITAIGQGSIFSGFNHCGIADVQSGLFGDCFGFSQEEVDRLLEENHLEDSRALVKKWYDGYSFGQNRHMYNPWTMLNFIHDRRLGMFWANSGGTELLEHVIRSAPCRVMDEFLLLLFGKTLHRPLCGQLVMQDLPEDGASVYTLAVSTGYLSCEWDGKAGSSVQRMYRLRVANLECLTDLKQKIRRWYFGPSSEKSAAFR